ncbi:zinc finger, CCHC-type, viral movement protein [Salix suchowensis]|nr:zinc finger, CCHC-type, viral movement protein [Salix suchowensis]
MTSSSSSSSPPSSSLQTSSSSFHLPPSLSFRKSTSTKLAYLYEVNLLDDTQKISETDLPLVNLYHAFVKKSPSVIRNIKILIKNPPKMTKEYVQAFSFDQHKIPATSREQFVTLEIPSEFPEQWITQGYTHIHFGAIRLALSYHGRKGLPVAARLALLDTRYLEYQHACIESLETTLNCGTVVVTFYPNFKMASDDPQLHHFLKVQLQITGADQVLDTYQATLHYQMAYRVQNHAFDLVLPVTNDALLITVDTNQKATCTHVPRQIPKDELQKLLPSSWITNYKKLHQKSVPIQSMEPEFTKKTDGTPIHEPLLVPIESFSNTGLPVYSFAEDNHNFWDTCHCDSCSNEAMTDKDDTPRHKRKSSVPTVSMYQPTRPYDDDFPALQEQVKDKVRTLPQIQDPQGVDAEGRPKQVTQAEAVLNWQSQNAIAQNSVLHRIESKVNLNPRRYQPHIHSSNTRGYFTLDDIPRVKWRDRMLEFHSWLTSYMLKDGVTLRDALQQFTAKFSGTLWDWFHALGDYRQLQFVNKALNDKEIARYEYFKMKCSYLRSNLEKHFKEMCRRYHILSGPDDPSLKHAFLASIPRDLADETFRLFKIRKEAIDNQSLGTIFHQVLEALNKMCDQHKYFTKILQPDKTMLRACKRPDLMIKCSDNADCNCPMKKKWHFKKMHRSSFNSR